MNPHNIERRSLRNCYKEGEIVYDVDKIPVLILEDERC